MKAIVATLGFAALLGGCAVAPIDHSYGYATPYAYGNDYGPFYSGPFYSGPGYYGYYDYGPAFYGGFSYYGGRRHGDRGLRDHGHFRADADRHPTASPAPANRWSGRAATAQRAGTPRAAPDRAQAPARSMARARIAPESRPAS